MAGRLARLWVVICVVVSVRSNDIEESGLRIAACRRVCKIKYPGDSSCLPGCTMERACSLHSCRWFCAETDQQCIDTCDGFSDPLVDGGCKAKCNVTPNVTVTELEGQIATIDVKSHFSGTVLAHVFLLRQHSSGEGLTYLTSTSTQFRFSGLYPWFRYSVDVVLFYKNKCCEVSYLWTGTVSFDPTGPAANVIRFSSYPLPTKWIDTAQSGTLSNAVPLIPSYTMYNTSQLWNPYRGHEYHFDDFNKIKVEQRLAVEGLSDSKECSVSKKLRCAFQFGSGYLFNISILKPIPVLDESMSEIGELTVQPRSVCRYFPNQGSGERLLGLGCGTYNKTTVVAPRYHDKLLIKGCFASSLPGGPINTRCCREGLSCITATADGALQFAKNRSYVLYSIYDPEQQVDEQNQCKYDKPCDGFFQHISPTVDIEECANHLPLTVSLVSVFGVLAVGVSIFVWSRGYCGKSKDVVLGDIPSKEEALLGRELPKSAISQERYVDRGNFGRIFEGKLKVKLNDEDNLTTQYEVALKILDTKTKNSLEELAVKEKKIKEAEKAMAAEIKMMRRLLEAGQELDRNVLRMYGYVQSHMLVLELCLTNLTKFLKNLRLQIDSRTLSPQDVQLGTELSMDDHKNSISKLRDVTDPSRDVITSSSGDQEEGRVVQTAQGLSLLQPRERLISRGGLKQMSSYNDSVMGRMTKTAPSLTQFKDLVLTTSDLVEYCRQVANGMDFLHSIDLIHRDLAADNVLVKIETDGTLTLKISDFGQSRMLYNGRYVGSGENVGESQRVFRLRWTAPEIKQDARLWSKWSDLWSYGVFMWEVFTLGGVPYPGWPDHHVLDNLIAGLRMNRPPCCTESTWQIAEQCWDPRPDHRGEFCEIKFRLDQIRAEEEDKKLGVTKDDYTFCDTSPDPVFSDEDEQENELDETEGHWVVLGNPIAGSSENTPVGTDPKVSVNVDSESVKINVDEIAQF